MPNAPTSWSPLVNAIVERAPPQAQTEQRVCGESAGNIASVLGGLLQGPQVLVGFGPTDRCTSAGRSG
eukprot:1161433-Pelagomonas_calceolata.AAC.2